MDALFTIMYTHCAGFPDLFTLIEAKRKLLGIVEYAVSMTTLEEVFLRLEYDDSAGGRIGDADVAGKASASTVYGSRSPKPDAAGSTSPPLPPALGYDAARRQNAGAVDAVTTERPTWRMQFNALFYARMRQMLRDPRRYAFVVVMPALFMLVGMIIYVAVPQPPTDPVRHTEGA